MAIDSAMKRFSMLNAATPVAYPLLFEPDGAVDADDRAFLLHLYGGNAFAAPVVSTPLKTFTLATRTFSLTLPSRSFSLTLPTR